MAATTWHPYSDTYKPEAVLMANEVSCKLPPLETSGSGRRLRFAGTSKSFAASSLPYELTTWANDQASTMSTKPWMFTFTDEVEKIYRERVFPASTMAESAKFRLLDEDTRRSGRDTTSLAVWRFQHPTLPIQAHVAVSLTSSYYNVTVQTQVHYRTTVWDGSQVPNYGTSYEEWDIPYQVDNAAARALLTSGPVNAVKPFSQNFNKTAHRAAAKKFLAACQQVDNLVGLDLPDYRDPSNPAWLTLDLAETNYTQEFEQTVKLYLDTEETAKALKLQIAELVKTLRALGTVVTPPDEESTAYAEAAMGNLHRVTATMDAVGQHDGSHQVLLNLIDGTVRVACGKGEARGEAANAYEIAKFKAEITGQLDQFTSFVDNEAVNLEAAKIEREYTTEMTS